MSTPAYTSVTSRNAAVARHNCSVTAASPLGSGVPRLDELCLVDPAVVVLVGVAEDRVELVTGDLLAAGRHGELEFHDGDVAVAVVVELGERLGGFFVRHRH